MPAHYTPLPVSATAVKLKQRGQLYPILLDTDTFDRTGADGDIPVIPFNGGDEFGTDVLEGQWHKNWDANMSTFTATISGGTLRLTGVAAVAGTAGGGWIDNHHPVPLLDELEITVSMEVPVDDTIDADRDIEYEFYLKQDKNELDPFADNNYLVLYTNVTDGGLRLYIKKKVLGTLTPLASGSDYTMAGDRDTGDLEATIWRLVFNGKPGTTGATMSVYLKQAATLTLAESATEHEVTGSPFDVSDLAYCVAYPAYALWTESDTWFGTAYDSANRAASTYLRVSYPDTYRVLYNYTASDYGDGQVAIYDGTPSATTRVYDENHTFSSDCYIDNGLIRLQVDELAQYGLIISGYYGASWNQVLNRIYYRLVTSSKTLYYPTLRYIDYISPEEVRVVVRLLDSSTINTDYYMDILLTFKRGYPYIKMETLKVFPLQDTRFLYLNATTYRFGYVGDNAIGDDDAGDAGNNTTLSDNYLIAYDDAGGVVIVSVFTDEKPAGGNTRFQASFGGDLIIEDVDHIEALSTLTYIGVTPFTDIANLLKEAKNATVAGGAFVAVDGTSTSSEVAVLDAQNETVYYDITAGSDLPSGRYLAVFRIRDTNQVVGDVGLRVYNNSDSVYRNEWGTYSNRTMFVPYLYYSIFFDITDTDVTGTDSIYVQVNKQTVDANIIYVDYILIVPIGNGESWSQDLSHGAMRDIDPVPKLCVR